MSQLDAIMVGSTFRRVNVEDVKGLVLCFPPPEEQKKIVGWIGREVRPLNDAALAAAAEIERVQEHRVRLVSDVVTGKVDVRHLAPEQVDADLESIEALGEDSDDLEESAELDTADGEGDEES